MNGVQRSAQRSGNSRARREYGLVKASGLVAATVRIYCGQDQRAAIGPAALHEEYRNGTQSEQFPVGQMQQAWRNVSFAVLSGYDEVGLDAARFSNDGFVDGIVVFSGKPDLDVLRSQPARDKLQAFKETVANGPFGVGKADAHRKDVGIQIDRHGNGLKKHQFGA